MTSQGIDLTCSDFFEGDDDTSGESFTDQQEKMADVDDCSHTDDDGIQDYTEDVSVPELKRGGAFFWISYASMLASMENKDVGKFMDINKKKLK